MNQFQLLVTPLWVNLLIFIPVCAYLWFRKNKLTISKHTLLYTALFAIAFGMVEASVVVYLRATLNLLPGYHGSLSEVQKLASPTYNQQIFATALPQSLLTVEVIREAATMVMLLAIAWAAAPKLKERIALFLWCFAIWDIVYYVHLWATVRWPSSLTTPDVLFLIPEPWLGQVWFPLLVSSLTAIMVLINAKSKWK